MNFNIPHTTIFVPYYSEDDSKLDQESSLMLAQLNENGRKKHIRSEKKMVKYLNDKIIDFIQSNDSEPALSR